MKILVICSNPSGSDYPKEINQNMLKDLIEEMKNNTNIEEKEEIIFMNTNVNGKRFPKDLPDGEKFHIIWMAGCNVVEYTLHDTDAVDKVNSILYPGGVVVFTETSDYINDRCPENDTSKTLSMKIECYKSNRLGLNKSPSKEDETYPIFIYWNSKFAIKKIADHTVYQKANIGGGQLSIMSSLYIIIIIFIGWAIYIYEPDIFNLNHLPLTL